MIEHTLNWYNGEIFEGKFILGFGIFLIITTLLFYFLGNTQGAKTLLIPFLVTGFIFTAIGIGSVVKNSSKIETIEQIYNENNQEFIASEIKRVDDFQYLYPMSITISLISFLISLGLLYFVENIQWRAIAMALILFGAAFAVIDYFSKERADIYYQELRQLVLKK